MLRLELLGLSHVLPAQRLSTRELAARHFPALDPERLVSKLGIETRHFAKEETSTTLAARALQAALTDAGLALSDLRRFVFVSTVGGEWVGPSNASAVLRTLGVTQGCECWDLNNACLGFLSALDVASRFVATGEGPVAIVACEVHSPHLDWKDARTALVFGDGAAGAVVGTTKRDRGILASSSACLPQSRESVTLRAPGLTGSKEHIRFRLEGPAFAELVFDTFRSSVRALLDQAQLKLEQLDAVVFHQPNGPMVEKMALHLGVPPQKTWRNIHRLGALGSASIPFALSEMKAAGRLVPGMKLLLVGVGAGTNYGAVLLQT